MFTGPLTALQLLDGGIAKRDGRLQVGDVVKKVGHPVCLSVCLSVCVGPLV